LNESKFLIYMTSSLVISISATVLTLVTGAMCAYALARMDFPGREFIAQSTLIIRMIPPAVLAVTVVGFWVAFNIADTIPGIPARFPVGRTVFFDGSQIGLIIFYTAIVDGANTWQTFFRVIMPLMGAGFAVSAIFTFRISWNEFILAFMLADRKTKTLPVFASEFIKEEGVVWGQMMSVGTLIVIPPIILTFFAAKQIIGGMTSGAVKG